MIIHPYPSSLLNNCVRLLLFSALYALFSLSLTACGDEPAEQAQIVRPVKVFTVGGGAGGTLEYPGQVSAALSTDMAFEVTGKLVQFPVQEGQSVEEGQLLAQLDLRDFESTLNSVQGEFDKTDANFKRAEKLIKDNYISRTDYDKIKAQRKTAQANLEKARKALEEATLRAPFAGQIAKKLVDDFANIQAKQAVLVLQDNNSLEIVINIPEADWAKAKPGISLEERAARSRPEVEVSSVPGRRFQAKLKEASTLADSSTRTYGITLSFPAPDDVTILPGMTAKAIIHVPDSVVVSNLQVPSKAVVADEQGNAFVWRIDPATMTVSKTPVKLGELSGADAKILQGLSSGDQIAVSGVNQLRNGTIVSRFE